MSSKRNVKVRQIGFNTWKVGSSVITRGDVYQEKAFFVAGNKPFQMANCSTFDEAVKTANEYRNA